MDNLTVITKNSTDYEMEPQNWYYWVIETFLCVLMTLTVILFSGSCLIIFLFSPRQVRCNFKNPTGFIMTWLSVIDFLSGFLLLVPVSITVVFEHEWKFGRAFCCIQGLVLQLIQNMANTLLMTVAVDRFCALVMPIKYAFVQINRMLSLIFIS